MSYHKGLSEWTGTVITHMPHLSKPQATVLAMWSFAMTVVGCCGLTTVSAFLAGLLDKNEDSMRQRLREWYKSKEDCASRPLGG